VQHDRERRVRSRLRCSRSIGPVEEALQHVGVARPRLRQHVTRHPSRRVAKRQSNDDGIIKRANDRYELRDQIDWVTAVPASHTLVGTQRGL
jgi:hypothetical protein